MKYYISTFIQGEPLTSLFSLKGTHMKYIFRLYIEIKKKNTRSTFSNENDP